MSNEEPETIRDPRLWHEDGWMARVIPNDNDDGWAVEMLKDGESEPALVGPWTMGRDKKNPKPLSRDAFATLVKTVTEVLQRHAHQRRAQLHKSATVSDETGLPVRVDFDIQPDDDDPHAVLSAWDPAGECLARTRVSASTRFTPAMAARWVERGYADP
ncbi:MAG: hypothetical protein R3A48_22545 [Polyangiales bacterium]